MTCQSNNEPFVYAKLYKCLFDPDAVPELKDLPALAKVLYCFLLDEKAYAEKIQQRNNIGEIFVVYTAERIARAFGIGKDTAMKLVKQLEDHKLITRKKTVGKADQIIVKDISEVIHISTLSTETSAERPLEIFMGSGSNPLDFSGRPLENSKSNYTTNQNNIDNDHPYSFLLPDDDDENESEMTEKKEESTPQTFKCLSQEEFLLMKSGFHYDYHQEFKDAATFNTLVSQLEDLLTRQRNVVRVHGQVMLWETVANRLMKITEDDLDYASICVERFNKKINNPNAFFTTVLWDCVGNGETGIANLAKADFGFS